MVSRFSQIFIIGSAAGVGWLFGQLRTNTKGNTYLGNVNLPGFPVLGTVSAASTEGILLASLPETVAEPQWNAPRIAQIMRFGFPSLNNIRSLSDYIISYDSRNRVPFWVFEHLTEEKLAKNNSVSRALCEFHDDTSIHEYFRSQNGDYKGSGYDRGHMAAAGNHQRNQNDCDETFLLSNIVPQVGKGFNRDKWNELEMYARKLTKKFKNVYICTGPLYLPKREEDGKLYVKYQVIGKNHVAVPTHFYKIVIAESSHGQLELESFVLPNQKIDDNVPIQTFYTPPEVVERASGLLFFDKVNRQHLAKINGKTVVLNSGSKCIS